MDFINLTERTGVPRTTNSVTANDPGAFCVPSAGKLAGVDATLKRLPLCPYASACPLPATVAPSDTNHGWGSFTNYVRQCILSFLIYVLSLLVL